MPMTCQEVWRALRSDAVGDGMSDETCAAVDAHLATCQVCQQQFAERERTGTDPAPAA